MTVVKLLAAVVAMLTGMSGAAVSAGPWPPEPANVEAVDVTETSVTLRWGPSPVHGFYVIESGRRYVVAGWEPSEDSRGVVGYEVSRDDGTLLATVASASYRLATPAKARTARLCVVPVNSQGGRGPRNCGTFTR